MQFIYQNKHKLISFFLFFVICSSVLGCGISAGKDSVSIQGVDVVSDTKSDTPRDSSTKVLIPEAPGLKVLSCETASVDFSNSNQGYLIAQYFGRSDTAKIQITHISDESVTYTYTLHNNQPEVLPLSEGNGSYRIILYGELSKDQLAAVLMDTIDVTIDDDKLPFLYPNHYVVFNESSEAIKLASELASGCKNDLEVVASVYGYVTHTLDYNDDLANKIKKGEVKEYIPDIDNVISTKKGICFDYAALMCAMLRSQGIPSKLDVGYTGNGSTHAWISVYVPDKGWIDNIIKFNGKSWTLMDPTTASSLNNNDSLKRYMGKLPNYQLKYTY